MLQYHDLLEHILADGVEKRKSSGARVSWARSLTVNRKAARHIAGHGVVCLARGP